MMTVNGYKYYLYNEIDTLLENVEKTKPIKTNKGIEYYNIPISFDIETSSITKKFSKLNTEKSSIMYIWQMSINNYYIIGRTWEEFLFVYNKIHEYFETNQNKRVIIYVHNLSFEFQFIRKWLNWLRIFSLDKRKPIQAITLEGIEFRCSYLLSGFSLEKLGDQLTKYKAKKKIGDIDYSKIRHCKTPLTDKELEYCLSDVEVVSNYIKECIENDGDITKIPLTKTGYVRNYCRERCFTIPHGVKVV